MTPNTRSTVENSYDRSLALAGNMGDSPWHEPQWADLVAMQVPSSPEEPEHLGQKGEPDEEVSSFDDLFVSVGRAGRLRLECPTCGSIPIPLRQTTLSDLTNASMDHLSERHPYSLTLPTGRGVVTGAPASPGGATGGYFTDHFWSLIALLSEEGVGIEALARTMTSSSEKDVTTFEEQLGNAIALLDTPAHRGQHVVNLDDLVHTVPSVISDEAFLQVRAAVVASGRDVWLSVLAEPARLTGGWSLQSGRALLETPRAALRRSVPAAPLRTASESRALVSA